MPINKEKAYFQALLLKKERGFCDRDGCAYEECYFYELDRVCRIPFVLQRANEYIETYEIMQTIKELLTV